MAIKSDEDCVRHTEHVDSRFNLIRYDQQCLPWSPPRKFERVTTEGRASVLSLSYWFTLHTSAAKSTSNG